MKNLKKQGFTLVEIMIVVMIIGLLAAIAIPGFQKARESAHKNTCISNQRTIDGAVDTYAIEHGLATDATVTIAVLTADSGYLKDTPTCPIGDTAYGDQTVGTPSACQSTASAEHVR